MKFLRFYLLVLLTVLLSGCNFLTPSVYGDLPDSENGIRLQTQFPVYSGDAEMIQVILYNNTEENLTFGSSWSLEIQKDGIWKEIPFIENAAFTGLAYTLAPGGTHSFTVYTSLLSFDFPDGKYRILKKTGDTVVAADFYIGESSIGKNSPYGYTVPEKLPKDYSADDAAADGVIFPKNITEENSLWLRNFFTSIENSMNAQLRFAEETTEGELILTDVLAERKLGTWRFTYRMDASRAGGEITETYYSCLTASGYGFALGNTPIWSEDMQQLELLNACDWNEMGETIKTTVSNRRQLGKNKHLTAAYWSPDGRTVIRLGEEPLTFSISQLHEDGGESGHMTDITAAPHMQSITSAEWTDTNTILFICETDQQDVTGYVFYDTASNKVIRYTSSYNEPQKTEDHLIALPE